MARPSGETDLSSSRRRHEGWTTSLGPGTTTALHRPLRNDSSCPVANSTYSKRRFPQCILRFRCSTQIPLSRYHHLVEERSTPTLNFLVPRIIPNSTSIKVRRLLPISSEVTRNPLVGWEGSSPIDGTRSSPIHPSSDDQFDSENSSSLPSPAEGPSVDV